MAVPIFYNDADRELWAYGLELRDRLRETYEELRDEGCDHDLVYAAFDTVFGPSVMPEIARLALIRVAGNELETVAYDAVYEEVEDYIFEPVLEED